MSHFMQQIFAIKSRSRRKTKQMFWPQFFPERRPQLFYGTLLAWPTVHHLTIWGWVLFADLSQRNLAMKWNVEFTEVGKNYGAVWSRLWIKVHVLKRCSRPLVGCNALARLYILYFVAQIYVIKSHLSCEIAKKVVFGPPICRGKDNPDLG